MGAVLWWFTSATLIGWFSFPLTARLFSKLPSRGFAFSRALGILFWGILHWLCVSWGILKNDILGQSVVLGSIFFLSLYFGFKWGLTNIRRWLGEHWRMVVSVELVFLTAFLCFAFFRSTSSAIVGTEKPMELAFLNAILRSDTFPPYDPWLSGHSISYYYLGYVLVALLTRLTGVTSGIGYNLAQALWFALVAAGAYGLLVDLFAYWESKASGLSNQVQQWMLRWAQIAPVLLLLLGNAYGFLDVLHARGVLWHEKSGLVESGFWQWMGLRGLDEPPSLPYQWESQRSDSVIWWNAARVLQDTDYAGDSIEIIDEFPNFSFILGDLHAHVLAMPFVLIAIGLALDYFHRSEAAQFKVWKHRLSIQPVRFLLVSGLMGALALLNTWDWPIYATLYAAVYLVKRINYAGWKWIRLVEFLGFGIGMALVGGVLFLPFFLNFSSQASGLLPSLVYFTRGVHFWVMFFPLLLPLGIYLMWVWMQSGGKQHLIKAVLIVLGILTLLVLFNLIFSNLAVHLDSLGELFMANQGAPQASLAQLFLAAGTRRFVSPGTWLTLCGGLILCLSIVLTIRNEERWRINPTHLFVLLLVIWGLVLALLPEFIYLLDNFGKRMNTIFKFYFQCWILWSLAGAFGIGILWRNAMSWRNFPAHLLLKAIVLLTILIFVTLGVAPSMGEPHSIQPQFGEYLLDWLWLILGTLLLAAGIFFMRHKKWIWLFKLSVMVCLGVGLVYPVTAVFARSNRFGNPDAWTLDGSQCYRRSYPDLLAAVDWLWTVKPGVLAEAVEQDGGDYSTYARVSMLSGLPTVLGWRHHEVQWRGGEEEIGSRQADIALLYETSDWQVACGIIDKYNIEYIYIGDLERVTYDLEEAKFQQNLNDAFQQGEVAIYRTEHD